MLTQRGIVRLPSPLRRFEAVFRGVLIWNTLLPSNCTLW